MPCSGRMRMETEAGSRAPSPTNDQEWMRRAIALARKGEGLTRPNPPVGAVLVRGGVLVGEGFHERAGGPHAEIVALRAAGERARGATLYVTLEPCSTWGRTPPCTDAIIEAGIRRVVVGAVDPNPKHAGRGFRILKDAGIEVTEGLLREACEELIEPFAMLQSAGRPFVTLKLACSLDGRIADAGGRSRWITGEAARARVHELRRRVDGILVGFKTVLRDDPSLLPVPDEGRKPYRIVLDPGGRLPLRRKIFCDEAREQTIAVISRSAPVAYRRALERRGVRFIEVAAPRGRLAVGRVMSELGRLGLLHVLCEGGGATAGTFFREGLIDEAWFFYAPLILGANAVPSIGVPGVPLSRTGRWQIVAVEQVPPDVLVRVRPQKLMTALPGEGPK